jgi:uncharacterized protein (DUF58 family)
MTSASDRLLRRLDWRVVRRLDGQLQGAYRTVFRGSGIDFADLREYLPEDDVRHIDWNVTARLDEPYVRQYTEDRELTAWLVLDLSASMRFGGDDGQAKHSALAQLSMVLSRLLTRGGNKVGAILFDNGFHKVLPPRSGRNHVLQIAHEIGKAAETRPGGNVTDLDSMLRMAAATARRRSLVFVVSDFIGDDASGHAGWERALTQLNHRHEVVALRIVDPMELDLPDLGLILVEDAETGEQLIADTSDPLFRQRLQEQIDEREAAVELGMKRAGVIAHRVGTDQDLVLALVAMVERTKRRRG